MHKKQPQTKWKKTTFRINRRIIFSQQQQVVTQQAKQAEAVLLQGREERTPDLCVLSLTCQGSLSSFLQG